MQTLQQQINALVEDVKRAKEECELYKAQADALTEALLEQVNKTIEFEARLELAIATARTTSTTAQITIEYLLLYKPVVLAARELVKNSPNKVSLTLKEAVAALNKRLDDVPAA